LLHVALAAGYAVLGITHAAAVVTVSAFFLALLLAAYRLARPLVPPEAALAAAVLLAASPGMLRWGQQIMLDVPALALAAWAMVFLVRYAHTRRSSALAWFAVCAVAAMYTKQTIAIPLA